MTQPTDMLTPDEQRLLQDLRVTIHEGSRCEERCYTLCNRERFHFVARRLMREHGQRPQIVMTTPILEGLSAREVDGKIVGDKMSKSLDNYVGVAEAPGEQFGKLMSISDGVMWRYYELSIPSAGTR